MTETLQSQLIFIELGLLGAQLCAGLAAYRARTERANDLCRLLSFWCSGGCVTLGMVVAFA